MRRQLGFRFNLFRTIPEESLHYNRHVFDVVRGCLSALWADIHCDGRQNELLRQGYLLSVTQRYAPNKSPLICTMLEGHGFRARTRL